MRRSHLRSMQIYMERARMKMTGDALSNALLPGGQGAVVDNALLGLSADVRSIPIR